MGRATALLTPSATSVPPRMCAGERDGRQQVISAAFDRVAMVSAIVWAVSARHVDRLMSAARLNFPPKCGRCRSVEPATHRFRFAAVGSPTVLTAAARPGDEHVGLAGERSDWDGNPSTDRTGVLQSAALYAWALVLTNVYPSAGDVATCGGRRGSAR
jgi:hypothetical protein